MHSVSVLLKAEPISPLTSPFDLAGGRAPFEGDAPPGAAGTRLVGARAAAVGIRRPATAASFPRDAPGCPNPRQRSPDLLAPAIGRPSALTWSTTTNVNIKQYDKQHSLNDTNHIGPITCFTSKVKTEISCINHFFSARSIKRCTNGKLLMSTNVNIKTYGKQDSLNW